MPKNVKGESLGFFEHQAVAKYQKKDRGLFGAKKIRKNEKFEQSHSAKKGESLIVSKKVEMGTLLFWNGLLEALDALKMKY